MCSELAGLIEYRMITKPSQKHTTIYHYLAGDDAVYYTYLGLIDCKCCLYKPDDLFGEHYGTLPKEISD